MKVYEFLNVIESLDANVLAGRRGLNRTVTSIEVLEVPNTNAWIAEGTLILTTFYHLKNSPQKQLEIVQKLILNKASAILVNVGQFIENIHPNIINYAEFHGFPIIEIKKEISYDDILTPFYKKRYDNYQVVRNVSTGKQYDYFYIKNHSSIDDALTDLSETLQNPVYIEDHKGRLLFSSSDRFDDGWRKSQRLFSLPYFNHYESIITNWIDIFQNSFYTDFNYANQRRRVVLPLYSNKFVFALVHLTYRDDKTRQDLTVQQLTKIRDKLYIVMVKELLDYQRKQIDHYDRINHLTLNNETYGLLIHFNIAKSFDTDSTDYIDYRSIQLKYLTSTIQHIPNFKEKIVFEKNNNYFALLTFQLLEHFDRKILKANLSNSIEESLIPISNISISAPFRKIEQFDDMINIVSHTTNIGKHITHDDTKVFCYEELGIYEFLIFLKEKTTVISYVTKVLNPIVHYDNGILLRTLEVYLQENGNATQAANKLFIHRRTMTNRLKQISSLLNMDLNNAENFFILQFCIKIYMLSSIP